MGAPLFEKAPAKINLTLHVRNRRSDGYHELESLVAFADLADTLRLEPDAADRLEVTGPFAGKSGPAADNLVLKARVALAGHLAGLKGGRFLLEKNIPVAAGLGGGSADAAAALRLLARANGIALDDPRLIAAARTVGADVPVCLDPRPRIMRGIGELVSAPIELPLLPAVLVNPGIPLATREVFGKFAGVQRSRELGEVPRQFEALIEFLKQHGNDLTSPARACASIVSEVLAVLDKVPGVRLARMSGSGPTCFALFSSQREAAAAAQGLRGEHKDWWVNSTIIGSASEQP